MLLWKLEVRRFFCWGRVRVCCVAEVRWSYGCEPTFAVLLQL